MNRRQQVAALSANKIRTTSSTTITTTSNMWNYRGTMQPLTDARGRVEVRVLTMAVDGVSSALAIRSSVGIELWSSSGPRQPYEHKEHLPREETKNSRSISFSPDGRYFAYTNGQEIKVLKTLDWQLQCTMPRPKAFYLKFSPRGNYLCIWELYVVTKDKPEGAPNMFVYELENGAEVLAIVQKKQTDWEPSWSSDETLFALVVGGESHFYDLPNGSSEGFKKVARRLGGNRGGMLSLAPGHCPPYLAMYTPGTKGGPSMCKLYKYPAIDQNQTVACKSFFQADRVDLLWNKRGTGLLLLTSTEVDKSGASYYGNQAVHFMATKGDSCSVPLSKEGPVHCVKWSPKATEFLLVYGYMPSKAALYNLKCDVIFDFGEGPRNCAYFNPFGSLVVLGGFGNLPGNVEIWDVEKREKLANIKCPDTTLFEWHPNGENFITATTAPRLRISNGFKIYHYSGALLHETLWPQGQELLGVEWQQFPDNTFKAPIITKAKQEGIKSSQPEASNKAYTPPHLRMNKDGKLIPQPAQNTIATSAGAASSGGGTVTSTGGANNNNNTGYNNQKYKNVNKFVNNQSNNNNSNNNNNNTNNNVKNTRNNNNKKQQTPRDKNQQELLNNETAGENFAGNGERSKIKKKNKLAVVGAGSGEYVAVTNNGETAAARKQRENRRTPRGQQHHQQNVADEDDDGDDKGNNTNNNNNTSGGVGDKDTDKKIRNVAKKLCDIKKLKSRRDNGEILEINQLNKISKEATFLQELQTLKNSLATTSIALENPAN